LSVVRVKSRNEQVHVEFEFPLLGLLPICRCLGASYTNSLLCMLISIIKLLSVVGLDTQGHFYYMKLSPKYASLNTTRPSSFKDFFTR